MDKQNKLIITQWEGWLLMALFSEKGVLELSLEEEAGTLGNIYIGKVKTIVKNLNSAFVDYGEGKTGYFSLTDNARVLYADGQDRKLRQGDEIVVQVAKDAVKTKDPVLSSNLSFTGKYAVLTSANTTIGFSSKITDRLWRERLKPQLEEETGGQAGLIVRTNAYGREEELFDELRGLFGQYRHVLAVAPYRTCYSLLYQAEPGYITKLKSYPKDTLPEIVTDDISVYNSIKEYLEACQPEDRGILRLYNDPSLSLASVYSLKTVVRQACQKKVWLKSGGYLVIEPTEAMVVVDVNTGKYSGKKDLAATILMTNLEAAREVCRQLRVRNLSGIIIVDFIDMKSEGDRAALMEELGRAAAADPVKTTVVDMTPLGLVELTRKKERRPLFEQLAQAGLGTGHGNGGN